MKIALVTLGCKLNYAETSTYERGFVAAGLEPVSWRGGADVFLVNTCTVTETANRKSRGVIRKLHRLNPLAPIVVTGCYAEMKPDEVASLDGVARVFRATEKNHVVSGTLKLIADSAAQAERPSELPVPAAGIMPSGMSASPAERPSELPVPAAGIMPSGMSASPAEIFRGEAGFADNPDGQSNPDSIFGAYSSGERTRSFLKVQDGCDNFCRYCTVPYARGRSRNIPICEAVKMAREIAAKGIREIVLTGVNTGDFGRTTGESFLDLLKALNEVEGIERYRISSIEPNLLTGAIVDWIASGTKFQPHFHIPLQAGCDELLAAMGRKYTTAQFASKIEYIRKAMEGPGKPLVFFGIDVMAGLPGETPELFEKTYAFLERIRPAFIHVFPYSKRPGTPAAVMPAQVPETVKAERVARLEELCSRLHSEFAEANRGSRGTVLWESREKDGTMGGYTGNYIRISRPYDPARVNTLEEVII